MTADITTLPASEFQALIGVGGLPVVIMFVQLAKAYISDTRAYPVLALAFGVLWNLLLAAVLALPLGTALLAGVLCGLTAAGTFSTAKAALSRAPQP